MVEVEHELASHFVKQLGWRVGVAVWLCRLYVIICLSVKELG